MPVLVIEFDGRYHRINQKVKKNDAMKDNVCKIFEMPIKRISSEMKIDKVYLKNVLEDILL